MNSAVIKSAIRTDDRLAGVSPLACLAYTWAHTACDDYGRLKSGAGWWAMNVVPGRASVAETSEAIAELIGCGVLEKYEYGGDTFVRIVDWFKTQSFQELHMMQAKCPNPSTGEFEQSMLWRDARDYFGLRRRAPKTPKHKPNSFTVKNENLTVSGRGECSVTVKCGDLTVKTGDIYTTYGSSSNTGADARDPVMEIVDSVPYWHGCTDDLVVYIAESIAGVQKFAKASRPPTLERVIALAERYREAAPNDSAIRDVVLNWKEFHSADVKAKFSKDDPIASIRNQLPYMEPKWVAAKKRTERFHPKPPRASMADELARIVPGMNPNV